MLRSIPYAVSRGESEHLRLAFAGRCRDRPYDAAPESPERDWDREEASPGNQV